MITSGFLFDYVLTYILACYRLCDQGEVQNKFPANVEALPFPSSTLAIFFVRNVQRHTIGVGVTYIGPYNAMLYWYTKLY